MRSTRAFLIGAGTAYLLDPRQGRRRRDLLRDRTGAVVRRGARLGERKAKFASGNPRGLAAVSRRLFTQQSVALDDPTVTQRIRSKTLRDVGVSTRDVEVEVDDGIATLRGSAGSRSVADGLVTGVAKVPGVRDVAAMLRVSSGDAGS